MLMIASGILSRYCLGFLLLLGLLFDSVYAGLRPDTAMSIEAIAQRIEPIGKVNIKGESPVTAVTAKPAPITAATGKLIYQRICSDCHATGEVRSPRFGSYQAWAPRYAKGYDILDEHALEGFNFMPPKGTCDECSAAEIKAAVRYMVEHSIQRAQP